MKLVSLSFHIKDIGVEGLSQLNHLFLSSESDSADRGSFHHNSHSEEALLRIRTKMNGICQSFGAAEMFYLATCNRFEFVLAFEKEVPEGFSLGTNLIPRAFLGKKTVMDHLLGVALSRDSVVFGENQIMGQIKAAFTDQIESGNVGPHLNRVISLILREAKSIRTEMGLSNHHTSVASVAARSVLQFFREHHGGGSRKVLLIGAGESNQTFARYFAKRELRDFVWLNRTQSRADLMATEIGGSSLNWTGFIDFISDRSQTLELPQADVICCATGAGSVLVTEAVLKQVRPRVVVDISMPSNTDRNMVTQFGAVYVGLDDINTAMKQERTRYEEILREMNAAIEESVAHLMGELMVHQSGSVLKDSVQRSEQLLNQVWEEELPTELRVLSDDQVQALQRWSQKLVKRLTHTHLETLKVVLKKPTE